MLTEDRASGEIVDEILRHVVDHRDLLEHHLTLAVDIRKRGSEHHVGHRIQRLLGVGVRDPGVEHGRLTGGGGVELAPHAVEELGDLERVVP